MRTLRYQNGGVAPGDPRPPAIIQSDPNFTNVRFIGSGKEQEFNQGLGFGGYDFRYDLDGIKFYGMDDDGLVFIDENGNAFSAERDYKTGSPDDEFDGYDDMFNYLKSKGAKHSDEYYDMVRKATEEKSAEPKGPTGTMIHKNELITGSGNPRNQIIDNRPGREDMRPGQLRRGLRRLQRQQGREGSQFNAGGRVMSQPSRRGLTDMFRR